MTFGELVVKVLGSAPFVTEDGLNRLAEDTTSDVDWTGARAVDVSELESSNDAVFSAEVIVPYSVAGPLGEVIAGPSCVVPGAFSLDDESAWILEDDKPVVRSVWVDVLSVERYRLEYGSRAVCVPEVGT